MNNGLIISCLAAFGASGCFFESDDDPPPPPPPRTGTLVVEWTVDQTTDPEECDQGNASDISIALWYGDGAFAGEFLQDCAAFATSIELDRDSYYGSAVLVSPGGREQTTMAELGAFEIFGGDELVIPIDFPASSFF